MSGRFGNQVALVTGAAGGIGRAITELLASEGAAVIAADLPRELLADQREIAGAAALVECDLAQASECSRAVALASAHRDRLDILVHAAGITRDGVLWKLDSSAWDQVIAVNLTSAFHLARAAVPIMRAAGRGSIVLISSINGERGKFGQTAYAASKAGLAGLGKSLAREVGRFGIRVNLVSPGLIETSMTRELPAAVRDQAILETCLGRAGAPVDVAQAVAFLASAAAGHVTGQVLSVDGGQLA